MVSTDEPKNLDEKQEKGPWKQNIPNDLSHAIPLSTVYFHIIPLLISDTIILISSGNKKNNGML